jgi:hemerythrin
MVKGVELMAFMGWELGYSVGVHKIDDEHKRVLETINTLFDEMKPDIWDDVHEGLLRDLLDSFLQLTKTEKHIFTTYNYPQTLDHMIEHQRFIEILKEFIQDYHDKKAWVSIQILAFLSGWLKSHFLVADQAYSVFLKRKGIDKLLSKNIKKLVVY